MDYEVRNSHLVALMVAALLTAFVVGERRESRSLPAEMDLASVGWYSPTSEVSDAWRSRSQEKAELWHRKQSRARARARTLRPAE